jgi:hypothetical protein
MIVTAQGFCELTAIPEGRMVAALTPDGFPPAVVRRCSLTVSKPELKARLKLKCDRPLSNFASNFNLRRYAVVRHGLHAYCNVAGQGEEGGAAATVWSVDAARVCRVKAAKLLDTAPAVGGGGGRGLHSSTSRLNVSAFCGTGGALRGR